MLFNACQLQSNAPSPNQCQSRSSNAMQVLSMPTSANQWQSILARSTTAHFSIKTSKSTHFHTISTKPHHTLIQLMSITVSGLLEPPRAYSTPVPCRRPSSLEILGHPLELFGVNQCHAQEKPICEHCYPVQDCVREAVTLV